MGADIGLELELLRRWDVTVRSFDAMDYYVELGWPATSDARLSVHHAAIALEDGPLTMQVTHDPISRSVSADGLYEGTESYEAPGRTIASLMQEFGDDHVDFFKLDVEGSEYGLLANVDLRSLGVRVFSVQLHHTGTVAQARRVVRDLAAQGYRLVAIRPAAKLTFLRADLTAASPV
jgi:hypothetical protein